MKQKTGRKLLSFLLTLAMVVGLMPGMGMTAQAASTTVTWNPSDIVPEHPWDESFTKDGITITAATCDFQALTFGGGGTFTTTLGNFTKIEISADYAGDVSGTGWSNDGWQSATWTGNAASVSFSGDIWGGGMTCDGGNLTIVFTIATVPVTGVTLDKTDAQTIEVGGSIAFTATVAPDGATDKTVKWSVGGTNASAVTLYSDSNCTQAVGADATSTLTVYAKGISAGSATVTCTSNADSTKTASCAVTVNAAQTQTGELMTTITATGKEQASYNPENLATVSFSYTAYGSSAYNANWGWWGYGWSATVNAAEGYTITKCVFYDDANRTATDSEAPFVVETTEEDKTPKVNGNPILAYTSKGIKKIEVYGYATPAATHSVTITPGSNMTKTTDSGDAEQTGLTGAMTDVVYTADDGYYFPTDYSVAEVSGIKVTRDSYTQITVSGTPTADAAIALTAPTAKTTPDAPTTAAATDCTTADNNNGKLTGVTTAMEYKKSDAENWTDGTGSDIENLVPGTYYVRYKATDTANASANQELTIKGFISYTVTFKVVNGKWNEGEGDAATADKTVTLTGHDGDTLKLTADQIPAVGTKPNDTYKAGSWDKTPSADTEITGATTYTYTYAQKDGISQTVTFKVVNGSWNEGDGDAATADKTVTLTGYEGDTLKLAANQIPAVGGKPNDTYKAGSWDTTPSADTEITADTTYTYTYAQKESISQTVTFKVVNGSWNDETTADKTVTLTGYEGDTLKLAANQIPTVGTKPNETYKAGSWDVTPSTDTAITEATTYTYTYAQKDSISQTVTFKVVNGSWNDETTTDKTVTLTGYEGDTLKLAATDIPAVGTKPNDTYKAGSWDVTPSTETGITAATTYTYTYAQKDSISQTVTFKVVNGSWNDETTTDKTVTLTGYEGDTLKLAANQIPTVGTKPNDTYKAGSWDVTPSADTAITAATTYTYTYAAKEASVVTKAPTAKTLTYTGSAQELVTAGTASGGEIQYALGDANGPTEAYAATVPTGTDAGTYYVWYMVKGDSDHTDSAPLCAAVVIAPEGSSGTPTANTLVYNGSAQALVTAGEAEGGTMLYILGSDGTTKPADEDAWSTEVPTGTDAGSYYVWYMVRGDANHNDSDKFCIPVEIAKKTLNIQAEAKSKTEGEADPELTYTVDGLVGTDTVSGALSREAGEAPGTYPITQGTLTAGENYEIVFTPAVLTVDKAEEPAPASGGGGGYYPVGGTVQNQQREAYGDVVGAASASYWGSSAERIHNIELACEKLDGIVLQPGEVFSFNEAVGGLTAEDGFAVAPVNPDDAATAEMGGGVSQVASTLYTGSLFALLETVERTNHPFAVPFIQPGTDAYVTDPGNADALDLKFRNTRSEPIRISAKTKVDEARQVREIVIELRSALGSSDYMPIRFDNTWGGDQNAFLTATPYDLTRPGYRILLTHEEQQFTDASGAGIRTLTHRKILDAAGMLVRDEILNSKLPDGSYAMDTYYQG